MNTRPDLRPRTMALFGACLIIASCATGSPAGAQEQDAYLAELALWKKERVASLKGPEGYLNLVGLFWLRQEQSTFGSSPDNDFVISPPAPARIGSFRLQNDEVVMTVEEGVEVLEDGSPVRRIIMEDDHSEWPVVLTHDSLAWTVIRRDDKFAVRVRDFNSPAIEAFKPIDYFPVNPSLRVAAVLRRFDEPKQMRVDTVITGLDYRPRSPGTLAFEIDGEAFELEAYESGDRLFLVFGDLTSGYETYPAGRFLYAEKPDDSGVTVLDFNKAYNPPCAFNEFATCPVASPQNRLQTRIAAGELFDASMHVPGKAH